MKNNKHYGTGSYKMIDKDGKEYLLTVEHDEYADNPRNEYNVTTMICWHRRYNLGDSHAYDGIEDFFQELCEDVLGKSRPETDELKWTDMLTMLEESNLIYIKQLNLYEHSGITISTSNAYPYNDRWDSSPVGFVYITKEHIFTEGCRLAAKDEDGNEILIEHKHEGFPSTYSVQTIPTTNENWKDVAKYLIDCEVERYDQHLRGEAYRYTLEEKVHYRNETKCPHCNEIIKIDEYDDYEEVDSCCCFFGSCLEENGILDSISSNLKFIEED